MKRVKHKEVTMTPSDQDTLMFIGQVPEQNATGVEQGELKTEERQVPELEPDGTREELDTDEIASEMAQDAETRILPSLQRILELREEEHARELGT